jgi:hypothetical protein
MEIDYTNSLDNVASAELTFGGSILYERARFFFHVYRYGQRLLGVA